MKLNNPTKLITSILFCQTAGLIGSIFTFSAIPSWYSRLIKPEFTPPDWLFGPVWLGLFALMGISLFLIWQKGLKDEHVKFAFVFFLVHLVFNALWSVIFFGLKNPLYGLVAIFILWIMVIISVFLFYRIRKSSALLLLPYFLWVSYAITLNFEIWRLNY